MIHGASPWPQSLSKVCRCCWKTTENDWSGCLEMFQRGYVRDWRHSFVRMLHAIKMEQHVAAYGFAGAWNMPSLWDPLTLSCHYGINSVWRSWLSIILTTTETNFTYMTWHVDPDLDQPRWTSAAMWPHCKVMHRSAWRAALLEQPFADFVPQRVKCHELLSTRVCQNTRHETVKASVSDKVFKMWALLSIRFF